MVGVAQLVEHLVVVQDVAGSSPVSHPNGEGPRTPGQRRPGTGWRGSRTTGGGITVDLAEELSEIAHGGIVAEDGSCDVAEPEPGLFLRRRVITDSAIGYGELGRYDSEAVGVAGRVGGRHGNRDDAGQQSDDHGDGWLAHDLSSFHYSMAGSELVSSIDRGATPCKPFGYG